MTNNITLTDSSGNVVTVGSSRIEEIWVNDIKPLPIPKTRQNQAEGLTTKLVNLMRIKRTFTIDGVISVGGDSSDFSGTDTAQQQRTKLRNMIESTENVTLDYDDVSKSIGITKANIIEESTDETTVSVYTVKILVMQGTNVLG